jgi:hypothetical protein
LGKFGLHPLYLWVKSFTAKLMTKIAS